MWRKKEETGGQSYEIGSPDLHYPDVVVEITPTARGYEVSVDRVHISHEYDKQADAYYHAVKFENLHSGEAKSLGEVSEVVYGRHQIDVPKDLSYELLNRHGELEREARQQTQSKAEFEKVGNSYYVESAKPGEWMSVTPREGGFDVAVGREDSRDHWNGQRGEYTQAPEDITLHRSHQGTVEDVQKAVEPFGIKLPESLNQELETGNHEISRGLAQEQYRELQVDWALEQSGNRMSGLPEESFDDYISHSRGRR